MERVKSIFRRDSTRRQDASSPYAPGTYGPNGVAVEHPLQSSSAHDHPQHQQSHQPVHHQHQHQHQQPPHAGDGTAGTAPTTPATQTGQLEVLLRNDTNSDDVYAYITGEAINNGNALFLLEADGTTPYYPPSPSSTVQPLQQNCSIHLGPPGSYTHCVIPFLAGARVWFSIGARLQFFLNPGPGLVEPSVFNQADPNVSTTFGFAEFTFNNAQLFANLSYVDFVGLPIAMTLEDSDHHTQHVSGLPVDGLQNIANGLRQQTAKDGQRWSSLIVNRTNGSLLRILSPNSGILLNPTWFQGYYANYVNQVYGRYTNEPLTIDTQVSYGNVNGQADGSGLNFGAGGDFVKPTAADIFSCSSGPFATGSNGETNAIIPRLAAAFNRSTLLLSNNQPNGVVHKQYYQNPITNHYARVVHAANLDGHGYAFPYDDVTPTGGVPQEGAAFSYSPVKITFAVGGIRAHVR